MPQPPIPAPGADPSDSREVPPLQSPEDAASHPGNEGWAVAPSPPAYGPMPPHGMAPQRNKTTVPFYKKSWVLVVATIVAVVGASAAGIAVINEMTERAERADCADRVIAHAKYPGGAEISDMRKASKFLDDDDTATYSHGYRGEADFPNGFGVPVRMYFFCKVTPMGTMDVEVDEDFFL